MQKLKISMVALIMLAATALTACGDAGTCVVDSSTGRSGWETCYENYTAAECEEKGETLGVDVQHSESSCSDRGFTKECSGEYGYRQSSYSCS